MAQDRESIAFVPTMGNLHAGHLALVKRAQALGSKVVVSIFVNPTQFDRKEDLAAYPRTLEQDCALLQAEGVDVVFTPTPALMYPLVAWRPRSKCRVSANYWKAHPAPAILPVSPRLSVNCSTWCSRMWQYLAKRISSN